MPSTQSFLGLTTHINSFIWSDDGLFTKFLNDVLNVFLMEIMLDNGHWVDLAGSTQWPLSNTLSKLHMTSY